jgi:hypothetical protein
MTGKHPFFVGPVFVHHFMNFESYYYYFSTLQRIESGLKNIQAIGSDGVIALQNAEFLLSTALVVNIVFFMSARFRTKKIILVLKIWLSFFINQSTNCRFRRKRL